MAKNGLLSEFRQDQGDDLPFVMSEVSEIKHLLPALPGEGPYPKNTYNVLEDLETADPEKAHRYVLGLVTRDISSRCRLAKGMHRDLRRLLGG